MIEHLPLPVQLDECFFRNSQRTSITETVGESIASFCLGQYTWTAARERGVPGFNISREAYEWAQSLVSQSSLHRVKRQAGSLRVRREYRRLTDIERANFHRAVNMLKADRSVMPNMYDALAAIHQGIMTTAAHGGPNFLGFHRVYLLMFENALRQKIPSVTVPYWDSTLDAPLPNPTQSVIFTDAFLGNGFGVVRTGPFAGWNTMSGPLIRNSGQSGQLFRAPDIARILSNVRVAQITEPHAPINSSLEFLHNQVHIWIDGQMGALETASHDPIFWMHHSYVDYVWELFRMNQRRFGIDPTRDYPAIVNHTMHAAAFAMGLANLRNMDGFSDVFASSIYTYERSPSCSHAFPDCGTPYLRCVMVGFQPACVSADWTAAPRFTPMGRTVFGVASQMVAQAQQIAMINAARAARARQALNLRLAAQRASVQSILPRQMIRQPLRGFVPPMLSEMEGGAPDDTEIKRLIKRRRHALMKRDVLSRKILRRRATAFQDPRGNSLMNAAQSQTSTHPEMVNFSPDVLPSMHMPENVQNASGVAPLPQASLDICPNVPMTQGYQNTFNVNGRSNIHQWVYVPVKIVYQRPPTFQTYSSFPVVDGETEAEDIYSPTADPAMSTVMPMGRPASYAQCAQQESNAGRVYVASKGLNYMGTYKEYAVVDHRLAISVATAYVAVKSPQFGASEVFLSAYDSCGRVCQPFCKLAGNPGFHQCSGAFRVTTGLPRLYGTNYGDAVTGLWQFGGGNVCPVMQDSGIYIQFHCSYRDSWPFGTRPTSPTGQHGGLGGQMGHGGKGGVGGVGGTATMSADALDELELPPSAGSGAQGMTTNQSQATMTGCHVTNACIVATSCTGCIDGQVYSCVGSCDAYATCVHGTFDVRACAGNARFDTTQGLCVPGGCFNNQRQWWISNPGWK